MENKKNLWLEALKSIFRHKGSNAILVISFSLIFPVFWGSFTYFTVRETSGDVPMQNIKKSSGYFDNKIVWQRNHYSEYPVFHSNDGKIYNFLSRAEYKKWYDWAIDNPKKKVYVEGFFLRNGKGTFFPTYIKTSDQEIVLNWSDSMEILEDMRTYKLFLIPFYVVSSLLWIGSFILIRREKYRLLKPA